MWRRWRGDWSLEMSFLSLSTSCLTHGGSPVGVNTPSPLFSNFLHLLLLERELLSKPPSTLMEVCSANSKQVSAAFWALSAFHKFHLAKNSRVPNPLIQVFSPGGRSVPWFFAALFLYAWQPHLPVSWGAEFVKFPSSGLRVQLGLIAALFGEGQWADWKQEKSWVRQRMWEFIHCLLLQTCLSSPRLAGTISHLSCLNTWEEFFLFSSISPSIYPSQSQFPRETDQDKLYLNTPLGLPRWYSG